MPSTKKQMRAAGMELRLRRSGVVVQQPNKQRATRPFGAASTRTLKEFASGSVPKTLHRKT